MPEGEVQVEDSPTEVVADHPAANSPSVGEIPDKVSRASRWAHG